MESNIAFVLNYAPHYREFILKKIDQELNADLYFGNIPNSSIKKLDYNELRNFKKELKTLKFKNIYWYVGSLQVVFKPYKKIILTGDPQILSNWLILIIGKILGKKVYLWTHGWYGKEEGLKKYIKKIYFKLAHVLFLYGEYSKQLLINEGFNANKLIVIYNSLDYENQILIKKQLIKSNVYSNYFMNEDPVLFYIGRIQESKKLEQILDAMIILKTDNIETNLVIVGGSDSHYNFKEKIRDRNLEDKVWLVGPVYNEEDIAKYIYNANVCISPGNIGLTALHALIYDTPIITHNNFAYQMPEFETITDFENGLFFQENDTKDLADKIKLILNLNLHQNNLSNIIHEKWNPIKQIKIFKNAFNR